MYPLTADQHPDNPRHSRSNSETGRMTAIDHKLLNLIEFIARRANLGDKPKGGYMTDLITADEACELLGGVARSTLWRWGKSDPLLAPRRFGPQVHRFSRDGIAEYLEKQNTTNHEIRKNDH